MADQLSFASVDFAAKKKRTKKRAAEAAGVLWAVKEKAKPGRDLTQRQRARNRRFGKVRAKVEHVFRVLKCQFGYRKVRYRGIAKNGAQVIALLALAISISPAAALCPLEGKCGPESPAAAAERHPNAKTEMTVTRLARRVCYSEVP